MSEPHKTAADPQLAAALALSRFSRLLPPPSRERLARTGVRSSFPAGAVLLRQGEAARRVCLVVGGALTVRRGGYDGTEEIVDHEGPGVMFGLGALNGAPSPVTWQAESEGVLYAWEGTDLEIDVDLRAHLRTSLSVEERAGALVSSMRRSPLFRHTSPALLRRLVKASSLVRFPAGAEIVREGEPGDTVYHIVEGEVAIRRASDPESPLTVLRAGDTFGELALVGDVRRTATVTARRELEVLATTRPDFELLREECPSFRRLLTELARDRGVSVQAPLPAGLWWLVNRTGFPTRWLAGALADEIGRQFGEQAVVIEGGRLGKEPAAIREGLERTRLDQADYVLCVADRGEERVVAEALEPLAYRLLYFTPDASAPCDLGEGLAGRTTFVEVRDPGWTWSPPRLQRHGTVRLSVPFRPEQMPRGAAPFGPELRHSLGGLARAVTDRTIGLALGGGAAWGFAHFALLRALDRAKIPIDVLSGTSMGALTGSFYASLGLDGLDLLQRMALEVQLRAAACLVSSRAVLGLLRPLRHRYLEELPLRFFPVAVDIHACEKRVFRQGEIGLAVRASCSLPGVFGPTPDQGRRYVDGCVMDNVPIQPLDEEGVDFVIASTAIPSPPPRYPMQGKPWRQVMHQVSPLERVRDSVRSLFLLFHASGLYQVEDADVVFSARVAPFQPYDFTDADRIIATAEAQVEPVVAAIQAGIDRLRRGNR